MNGEKRPPYAYMIQEALLSEGRSLSKIFISEYILVNYPCLIHDDDHTTLLSQTLQDLTQRKILSVIIDVEDQSGHHYTLEKEIYYENTGAERPTTAPHLRPSNYPQVVVQHPQGGKEGENGIRMKKRMRKSTWATYRSRRKTKIRSVGEISVMTEEEKRVVLKVLKNVLEARVAAVAKTVVAQVACGIERQRIVEQVMERIEGMVLEVSESIVEIAEAPKAAADHDEVVLENTEDHDEVALENTEDHQHEEEKTAADPDEVALENTEDHQHEEEKRVVQKVLRNVLEARVAAVAKAVVEQAARGIERQRIVEQVIKRIEGMVLEVSESIVEIAEAVAAAAAAEAAEAESAEAEAAAAAAAAATDHDEIALENTEDHQHDDD